MSHRNKIQCTSWARLHCSSRSRMFWTSWCIGLLCFFIMHTQLHESFEKKAFSEHFMSEIRINPEPKLCSCTVHDDSPCHEGVFPSSRWWGRISWHLHDFLALKFSILRHLWALHEVSLDRAWALANFYILMSDTQSSFEFMQDDIRKPENHCLFLLSFKFKGDWTYKLLSDKISCI